MVITRRAALKTTILWLTTLMLTVACSTAPIKGQSREKQLAALDRWNQCVERMARSYDGPFNHAFHYTSSHCDGYHRDVLMTFPAHLENQVSELLSQKTAQIALSFYTKAKTIDAQRSGQSDKRIEKLNTKLIEAQISDL